MEVCILVQIFVYKAGHILELYSVLTQGDGGIPLPTIQNLLIPPPPRKIPSHQKSIHPLPPLNKFSSYNPIKIAFLVVVIALVPFLF